MSGLWRGIRRFDVVAGWIGFGFGFGFGFGLVLIWLCAGVRDLFLVRQRCPCAGRHLLSLPPQGK
jgi:hypothetical protein